MEDLMNKLTEKTVAAKEALKGYAARAVLRVHDDERGQGTVEYVGAVLLVVAVVGIVIAASTEVGEAIVTQLTEAVTDIGGAGGGGE
jgi:Flp pilus assembly pilin Flp